jgi:DNA-binding MarR family transcriptional regulator
VKPATAPALQLEPRSSARLGYLIYRVERLLRARIDESVRDHGVTTTEYVTLSVLRHHDGLSCAQLARWAYVTPQAMNLVVSALERRRLVRRRPDPANRRVLRASVTPKGLEALEACDASMDAIEADMVRDLTEVESDAMHDGLAASVRSLEATTRLPQPRALRSARKRPS